MLDKQDACRPSKPRWLTSNSRAKARSYSKNLPRLRSRGRFLQTLRFDYGLGEEVVVVDVLDPGALIVVLDSVLVDEDGDSFTTVVLFSVLLSPGGLVTVV